MNSVFLLINTKINIFHFWLLVSARKIQCLPKNDGFEYNKQERLHTYAMEMFSSAGCEESLSGAVTFVLAESDLVGSGGFTLVEERPKVLGRHMEFLPAESDTHKFNFQQGLHRVAYWTNYTIHCAAH